MLKVLVNDTQFLLETTPYSEYNVSVAAKPAAFGIWSASEFTAFKTLAAGAVLPHFSNSLDSLAEFIVAAASDNLRCFSSFFLRIMLC